MGHAFWAESIVFVLLFTVIIAVPCVFVAILGSRMVNEIGNAPTQSVHIQSAACWKVFLAEVSSFVLLAVFFHIFK